MSRRISTPPPASELVVERGQRVVAIPHTEDGREVVRYVIEAESKDFDANAALPESAHVALGLAGAWDDLDWDKTVEALDRIRHESRPTPPIEPDQP
ncbi:MAG: hypothetical protein M3121_05950 [Chloroflexota bacterium]|nr:hypothetical protein [Chloroflexota bacterium]